MPLKEGEKAPAFNLPAGDGASVKLADYKGKKVVLYFYPKDNTPGCTQEACDFQASLKAFQSKGAVVLGVSADPLKAHSKFAEKYKLSFPLLSDESTETLQKYGVWKEKSMYGKKFMGVERTTVIIDKAGQVRKIFPKVKVAGHTQEVLASLDEI